MRIFNSIQFSDTANLLMYFYLNDYSFKYNVAKKEEAARMYNCGYKWVGARAVNGGGL